jgi:hypothetical protein
MGIFDGIKKKERAAQDVEQRCAVSLVSGRCEVRPPDINLWCIGNDYRLCVVLIPLSAWERMDSIITLTSQEQWRRLSSPNAKHSQEQKLVISVTDTETGEESSHEEEMMTNCGFRNLYTDTPVLMPVLMSVACFNDYCNPLARYIEHHLAPPKSLAQTFLQNVEFIESDQTLCIPLHRRSKNPRKRDKFTMLPHGDKIEIFETYSRPIGSS